MIWLSAPYLGLKPPYECDIEIFEAILLKNVLD